MRLTFLGERLDGGLPHARGRRQGGLAVRHRLSGDVPREDRVHRLRPTPTLGSKVSVVDFGTLEAALLDQAGRCQHAGLLACYVLHLLVPLNLVPKYHRDL